MSGPYGQAADGYWQVGWRGILPLPPRAKANPPGGYTGEHGVDPSYADVYAWATGREGTGNIALRLPRNVIGLDVDAYGGKPGAQTLHDAEAQWGALPTTWRTTSRDDGTSGIRLYRVPEGLAWPGELGAGTEIIQHRHRYAVVCPSVHPEGRTYRWINPAGVVSTAVPDPDELPTLPDAWVEGLTRGEMARATARGSLGSAESAGWLVGLPGSTDRPCARMRKAIDQMSGDLLGSAHAAARDGSLRAVRLASEGHAGVVSALADMKQRFLGEATSSNRDLAGKRRRTPAEADREWTDLLTGATNLVTANPSDGNTCDCDGQLTALVVGSATATLGSNALAPDVSPQVVPASATDAPITEQEKHPQEATSRLKDGATFILDLPDGVPTVWGDGDDVLWARGEALMLVGPPGVGKTTLCGQVLRGLLGLGGPVLGMQVEPASRRVLYLAMDRPAQIARSLRRTFGPADREVLADRLRVWEGPPPADVARNTDILKALAELADADVLIIDSVKDAAIGLTDDEIAAGYNRARQTALAAGVEVLELHHLVKRGANGSKPTTLADVYGSAWLTAGAGSVVLLWGAAGDPIVELLHLKQPAGEVGPWKVVHDHAAGRSDVFQTDDLASLVAAKGAAGMTARDAAVVVFDTAGPSRAEVMKAARRLDDLVKAGLLDKVDGQKGGAEGGRPTTWRAPGAIHRPITTDHTGVSSNIVTAFTTDHAETQNRRSGDHATDHADHAASAADRSRTPPPLKEGGVSRISSDEQETVVACGHCGVVLPGDADACPECGFDL